MYIPLESEDVEGFVHDLHFFFIIDGFNLDLAEAAGRIIYGRGNMSIKCFINWIVTVDVVAELAGLMQVNDMGDEEVENVVASLAPLEFKSELTSS